MIHKTSWCALLSSLVLALASCSDASEAVADGGTSADGGVADGTAAGDGSTGNTDGSGGGQGPTKLGSLDAVCGTNGLTGQHALDKTRPRYVTTLDLKPGTSGLTITLAYAQGEILCYPPIHPPPGSAAPVQPEHVTVQVEVGFETDDGTFDEAFVTPLSAMVSSEASFSHSLPAADLVGSFDPQLDGYDNVTVGIHGSFDGDSTQGHVGKGGQRPGKAAESFPFVAQWPATPADQNPADCTPTPSCDAGKTFGCAPVTQGMQNDNPPIVCGCFVDSCPTGEFLVVDAAVGRWCSGAGKGSAGCSTDLPP